MSGPTITFEINGQTVPSTHANWYKIAPCGCIAAATVVDLGDPRYQRRPVLTEADAWDEFYEGESARRKRDIAAGFTVRLGVKGEVMSLGCTHTPKWGIPEAPALDGYVWATVDDWPLPKDRAHLVAAEAADGTYHRQQIAALCGKGEPWWKAGKHVRYSLTCRRCEHKANRLASLPPGLRAMEIARAAQ